MWYKVANWCWCRYNESIDCNCAVGGNFGSVYVLRWMSIRTSVSGSGAELWWSQYRSFRPIFHHSAVLLLHGMAEGLCRWQHCVLSCYAAIRIGHFTDVGRLSFCSVWQRHRNPSLIWFFPSHAWMARCQYMYLIQNVRVRVAQV